MTMGSPRVMIASFGKMVVGEVDEGEEKASRMRLRDRSHRFRTKHSSARVSTAPPHRKITEWTLLLHLCRRTKCRSIDPLNFFAVSSQLDHSLLTLSSRSYGPHKHTSA